MNHAEANTFLAKIPGLPTPELENHLYELSARNDETGKGSLSVRSLLAEAIRKEIARRAT